MITVTGRVITITIRTGVAMANESFLNHVFHPKTVPPPKGLRKSYLKPIKGRKVSRVNAWNKLSAVKQRVVIESGQREAYLAGTVTYSQAKGKLREAAVKLGVTKPVRVRITAREEAYQHILDLVAEAEQVNPYAIAAHVKAMHANQIRDVKRIPNYPTYKAAARDKHNPDWLAYDDAGNEISLLWYH